MTAGMEGSRGGGPERGDQRRASVRAEVQEQVEVWILNIEEQAPRLDTLLPWRPSMWKNVERGDGLSTQFDPSADFRGRNCKKSRLTGDESNGHYTLRYSDGVLHLTLEHMCVFK